MDSFEDEFTAAFETGTLVGDRTVLDGLKNLPDDGGGLTVFCLYEKILESREFLATHLPWVRDTSVTDLKKRIRSWVLATHLGQGGCWLIYDRSVLDAGKKLEGHEVEAFAGCIMIDVNLKNHSATVSYWLLEKFTGRGLMTEALDLVNKYCLYTLRLNRMEVFASVDNPKSGAVAERCGYLLEGICRDFELKNGIFVDHRRYALLARDLKK